MKKSNHKMFVEDWGDSDGSKKEKNYNEEEID